jgi:hypothetical protein
MEADESVEEGVRDQSAFRNDTVTCTICSPEKPRFTIGGASPHSLDSDFKERITYTTDPETQCHCLSFPAWMEYNGATIAFIHRNGTEIYQVILHVQGVLGRPENLRVERVNSTHTALLWGEPPSLVQPANASYTIVFGGNEAKNTSSTNYTFWTPWPPDSLGVTVTSWNPVGEGGSSTVDLADFLAGQCEQLGDITPEAVPYCEEGITSVEVQLFTIKEALTYCLGGRVRVTLGDGQEMAVPLMFENGKAVIRIQNVPEEQYLRVTLMLHPCVKTVQCHFLPGASHNTCLIDVYRSGQPVDSLSGSDQYQLSGAGNYTLRVYDDEGQKERGIPPAFETSFNISAGERGKNTSGADLEVVLGIVGGAVLVVVALVVALALLLLRCGSLSKNTNSGPKNVYFPQDGGEEGSAMEPGLQLQSIMQSTQEDTKGSVVTGRHLTRLPQPGPAPALSRPIQQTVEVEMESSVPVFTGEGSRPLREEESRGADVLPDLEGTANLYQTPAAESQC